MYASFRNQLFNIIPGYCVSDLVYLGVIVFILAGLLASKKWTPFIFVLIFSLIFKVLDFAMLKQSPYTLIQQFLHMITLPFVLTLFYRKR